MKDTIRNLLIGFILGGILTNAILIRIEIQANNQEVISQLSGVNERLDTLEQGQTYIIDAINE